MADTYELASQTPVDVKTLEEALAGLDPDVLMNFYIEESPHEVDALELADVDSLEEQVTVLERQYSELYTLAKIFELTLDDPDATHVPGHATVGEVGVSDGTLMIDGNLRIDGTLVVAGDLAVGGQLLMGEDAALIVTGSLEASAIAGVGQISVGNDLRALFIEVEANDCALDVGGELTAFLLIQNDHVVRASNFALELHAVYPLPDAATDVFDERVLNPNGWPDWAAIAREAQAGQQVFVDGYSAPEPAKDGLAQPL